MVDGRSAGVVGAQPASIDGARCRPRDALLPILAPMRKLMHSFWLGRVLINASGPDVRFRG
jgi:hypothetical protein